MSLLLATSAFAQRSLEVTYEKTEFDVTVTQGDLSDTDAELQTYIKQGVEAVATYFGKFPVDHMAIRIRAVSGDRVRFGRSSPNATIMMLIGKDAHAGTFSHGWTLTHEMVNQAFPATKGNNHDWLSEGMAAYVEPIARAQAGLISVKEVWRQFVAYMPRGIPETSIANGRKSWSKSIWPSYGVN